MSLTAILARSTDGIIGIEAPTGYALPWKLSADLKRFKELTTGHAIIMGRKTFDSIGRRPLPNRLNVVLSRAPIGPLDGGIVWAGSVLDALQSATEVDPSPFVIGGAEVYRQFWPLVTKVEMTEVHTTIGEGIVFDYDLDRDRWRETSRTVELEENGLRFCFSSFVRAAT